MFEQKKNSNNIIIILLIKQMFQSFVYYFCIKTLLSDLRLKFLQIKYNNMLYLIKIIYWHTSILKI